MPQGHRYWPRYAALVVFGIVISILAVGASSGFSTASPEPMNVQTTQLKTVHIGGTNVRVTIADTQEAREKGLGGRTGLASDEGMLFIFPRDGEYAFWMKDMTFSIDIIWISADGRVVHVAPKVSPATYPEDFVPPEPARYVLEVLAGFAAAHGVKTGDMAGL